MLVYSVRPEVRIASLSPNSWGMWQGRLDPRVPLQPIDSTHQAVGHPARLGTWQRRNRADPFPGCAPQWLEKNTLPSLWGWCFHDTFTAWDYSARPVWAVTHLHGSVIDGDLEVRAHSQEPLCRLGGAAAGRRSCVGVRQPRAAPSLGP